MIVCTDATIKSQTMTGESRMLPGLIAWLKNPGRTDEDALFVQEFPINARRVDLAVMIGSGQLSSFELKLGGFARVLEQAAYNQLSFDKSWIVVGSTPRAENLAAAREFGIGVIVFNSEYPEVLLHPGFPKTDRSLRARLHERMIRIGDLRVQSI